MPSISCASGTSSWHYRCALLSAAIMFATLLSGCCCVPQTSCGMGPCSNPGANIIRFSSECDGASACDSGCADPGCQTCGPQFPGLISRLTSCRGACGEVYIDERINHPPVDDYCGYDCSCSDCGNRRPLLNMAKALWGRRYVTCCPDSLLVGPACNCDECAMQDSGCDSCGTHNGVISSSPMIYDSQPSSPQSSEAPHAAPPEVPMDITPSDAQPSPPSPGVSPSAARLNPALSRRSVRPASYNGY